MSIWKTLFGGAAVEDRGQEEGVSGAASTATRKDQRFRPVKDADQRFPILSKEAEALIAEALKIIEASVHIHGDFVRVDGAGSEGVVMEAARKLEAARQIHPESAILHFAYASALHVAAQYKTAEEVMKSCADAHPDFPLSPLAVEGWTRWKSPFALPPWNRDPRGVLDAVSQLVKTNVLLPTRDGLLPRATLFYRDAEHNFQNLQALQNARIELATVISAVHELPLVGIYGRIYDDPANPFNLEVLRIPFYPRGHPVRCTYEWLCFQEEIDLAVIDGQDRILLNKRLPFSKRMKEKNQELWQRFVTLEGREIDSDELVNAVTRHQRQFSHSDVRF